MKSLSGKNKSLIQKFRFLKSDLEWRKVIVEESRQEFLDEVAKNVDDVQELLGTDKPDSNENPNVEDKESILENNHSDPENKSLKKIYWNICKLTHPDKDKTNKYEDIFKRASMAYETLNALELFVICDELKIEYEISKANMKIVDINIADLEKQISNVTGTYIFKFNESETSKEKQDIVNMFIITNKLKNLKRNR